MCLFIKLSISSRVVSSFPLKPGRVSNEHHCMCALCSYMSMCVSVCQRLSSIQVWGSEEDVGEVLFLNVFVFSPLPVWSSGFGATEGKINTEQTSPGTQAIPRGILRMWFGMSGLPLLPHPENSPAEPQKIQRQTEKVLVCVLMKKEMYSAMFN